MQSSLPTGEQGDWLQMPISKADTWLWIQAKGVTPIRMLSEDSSRDRSPRRKSSSGPNQSCSGASSFWLWLLGQKLNYLRPLFNTGRTRAIQNLTVNGHSWTIYNSLKLESTQMPSYGGTEERTRVCIFMQWKKYSSIKMDRIPTQATTWLDHENVLRD